MIKSEFKKYNTTYQTLLRQRFESAIPDNDYTSDNYQKFHEFLFILSAPEPYEVEEGMLKYLEEHANATLEELIAHFNFLSPPGTLPPCASEWDDEEDE